MALVVIQGRYGRDWANLKKLNVLYDIEILLLLLNIIVKA